MWERKILLTDKRQPISRRFFLARSDAEEFVLQLRGDGPPFSVADLGAVDAADGRDLGGGAGEEDLVGDVKRGARDDLFADFVTQVARDQHHRIARDAGQDGGCERRGVDYALTYQEQIFAAAFADVAVGVERDAFDEAVGDRLHLDQLRVHVIRGRFGRGRNRVVVHPRPARHAHVDALVNRLLAEIFAPDPARDVDLDRVVERVDAEPAVAADDNRAQITLLESVDSHDFQAGLDQLIDRIFELRAVDFAGIVQPLDVLAQSEDGRPLRRRVAANAFEQRRAVMDHMRHDVDLRVVPIDHSSVVPYFLRGFRGRGWMGHKDFARSFVMKMCEK